MNTVLSIDQHRSLLAFLIARLASYWVMIKGLQTGLLLITALAGFASGCCLNVGVGSLTAMMISLFWSIAGCTILNMVYDRDIDGIMQRTARRPLPCNRVYPAEALILGIGLTLAGVIWAFFLSSLFGMIVLLGVVFDALIYTLWLKRRTPYSILIGGLAGGMPVLAGRVLAVGTVDLIGILLALGVLLWIPTHIMTFTLKSRNDYSHAGVPIFPVVYGVKITRMIIGVSTILAVLMMAFSGWMIGVNLGIQMTLWFLGVLWVILVMASVLKYNRRLDFVLYKGASIYMLGTMLVLIWGGL